MAGGKKMKKGIHPAYAEAAVKCSTCGTEFEVKSTKNNIVLDTCSKCHPAYTGKARNASARGRVERFNKKYNMDA